LALKLLNLSAAKLRSFTLLDGMNLGVLKKWC